MCWVARIWDPLLLDVRPHTIELDCSGLYDTMISVCNWLLVNAIADSDGVVLFPIVFFRACVLIEKKCTCEQEKKNMYKRSSCITSLRDLVLLPKEFKHCYPVCAQIILFPVCVYVFETTMIQKIDVTNLKSSVIATICCDV